jgi:hypothetical protein
LRGDDVMVRDLTALQQVYESDRRES